MKALLTLLCLAACAAPQPVYQPVAVATPVPVPCRAPAVAKPQFPLAETTGDASLFEKARAALIEIDLRKAYEAQLEAGILACRQ